MRLKILDSSYVVNFNGFGFDSENVRSIIKSETDKIISTITNEKLKDWEIQFIFRYNHTNQILIYTRGKSYSKEKYKEITIHIPIPIKDKVPWGVSLEQHIYKDANHLNDLIK